MSPCVHRYRHADPGWAVQPAHGLCRFILSGRQPT